MFIYFMNTQFMSVGCIIFISQTTAMTNRTEPSLCKHDSIYISDFVNSFSPRLEVLHSSVNSAAFTNKWTQQSDRSSQNNKGK